MGCCNADLEETQSHSRKKNDKSTPLKREKTTKTSLERIVEERNENLNNSSNEDEKSNSNNNQNNEQMLQRNSIRNIEEGKNNIQNIAFLSNNLPGHQLNYNPLSRSHGINTTQNNHMIAPLNSIEEIKTNPNENSIQNRNNTIQIQSLTLFDILQRRLESFNFNFFDRMLVYNGDIEIFMRNLSCNETEIPQIGLTKVIKNNKIFFERKKFEPLSETKIKELLQKNVEDIKKENTDIKRIWMYGKIANIKKGLGKEFTQLVIRRNFIFNDSFEQFRTTTNLCLQKPIKIFFIDEEAQDAGGLLRDWLTVLIQDIFKPEHGFFVKADTSDFSYNINRFSEKYNKNHLANYFFIGQVIGKGLFERVPISGFLNKTIYKYLLDIKMEYSDLNYYDFQIYTSLKFLLEDKINKSELFTDFVIREKNPRTGYLVESELIENGRNVQVDEENKLDFINRQLKFHTIDKQKSQLEALKNGFLSVIPFDIVSALDPDELEYFVCGDSTVDLDDWKQNTEYKGEYHKDHQIIVWFWKILSHLDQDKLSKVLHFCTGSNRVPPEGFRGLQSSNGKSKKFSIEPIDLSSSQFIIAHTCFNKLDVPKYKDFDTMKNNFLKVITNEDFFSFGIG